MYDTIEFDVVGGVATISLNRPHIRNAFNAAMIGELIDVFSGLTGRHDIFVVVLEGNGDAFCAGADVSWMRASLGFSVEENLADARRMSDMFAALDSVPQPVICRVHGAALGGALGLIACCDLVVASDDSIFGFTEVKLGIVPAVISRFVIPKIGRSWARALYLTGERFDANVAYHLQLVHWIAPFDTLNEVVASKVRELLMNGPEAVRSAKELISGVAARDAAELREYTATCIAERRTSSEGQEGLRAFLEKRQPRWRERE